MDKKIIFGMMFGVGMYSVAFPEHYKIAPEKEALEAYYKRVFDSRTVWNLFSLAHSRIRNWRLLTLGI